METGSSLVTTVPREKTQAQNSKLKNAPILVQFRVSTWVSILCASSKVLQVQAKGVEKAMCWESWEQSSCVSWGSKERWALRDESKSWTLVMSVWVEIIIWTKQHECLT